jgi:small GTP-binding protein
MREGAHVEVILLVDGEAENRLPADWTSPSARAIPTCRFSSSSARQNADERLGPQFPKLGFETCTKSARSGRDQRPVGRRGDSCRARRRATSTPTFASRSSGGPNVEIEPRQSASCGSDANIVDSRPGTTRDAIDASVMWQKKKVTLVDTAGIKRKARTTEDLDVLSTMKSLESIERCDVALVMLDATREITNQDVKVASYPHRAGKGVVVCFNKWDAVAKKGDKTSVEMEREFRKCGFCAHHLHIGRDPPAGGRGAGNGVARARSATAACRRRS